MMTLLLARIACQSPLRELDDLVINREDLLRLLQYSVSSGVSSQRVNQIAHQINCMPDIDLDTYARVLNSCMEIGELVKDAATRANCYSSEYLEEPVVLLRKRVDYGLIFEFIPGSKDIG